MAEGRPFVMRAAMIAFIIIIIIVVVVVVVVVITTLSIMPAGYYRARARPMLQVEVWRSFQFCSSACTWHSPLATRHLALGTLRMESNRATGSR